MQTRQGKFDIRSEPIADDQDANELGAVRMRFEKSFTGPLNGTSRVAMFGIMNRDLQSGAYVAIEKFTGSLDGKSGSFDLVHSSIMRRGRPEQSIQVVPDSATGELVGLRGEMTIEINEGRHSYTLLYELPSAGSV